MEWKFTFWVFTNKIRSAGLMPSFGTIAGLMPSFGTIAGLMPSFGTIDDGYYDSMMESFWSSMRVELLNRKKWRTRLDLANAIFDYIEIVYNRRRRHSQIDYVSSIELSPIEYELRFENPPVPA